jgi:hypothetical protein
MEPVDPRDAQFKATIHAVIERYIQALAAQELERTKDLFLPEFTYKTAGGDILSYPQALSVLEQDWGPARGTGSPRYTLEGLWVTQGQTVAEITIPGARAFKIQTDEIDPHAKISIVQRLAFMLDASQWKLQSIEEMGQGSFSSNPETSRPI